MNIRCLFGHHDWRFSYNHGVPLDASMGEALKMFKEDKTFAVDRCTRHGCGKQSRLVDGVRMILRPSEMENP